MSMSSTRSQVEKLTAGPTMTRQQVEELCRTAGLAGKLPPTDAGEAWNTKTIQEWAKSQAIRHRGAPVLTNR